MSEGLSFIKRNGGVKGVRVLCTAKESYISVICLMQTDVYHRLTSNPDDINGGPSVCFRYDPSTGAIAHYITGDTQSIYIPKYSFLFRDPAYVSHRNELDARLASIGVYATGSGAVLGFCHFSTTFDAIYAEGGGIDWVGNITRKAAIRDFNGSSEEYADYCIAGTFSRLGGVTCNGLAVMSCRRSANSPTVTAAYPLELVFDTRKNLTFHTSPGSSTLFVSGDFTAVNGVAADGAAVVLPPAAAWLLDPSDANYVEPDWRMVVLPLTCGKIEKPASYEDLSYGISQTGKNWTLEFGDSCRVPCLRRANTR